MIRHHFTVDVEEYFQVSALEPYAPYATWESFESRVEPSVDRLLELLSASGSTGTFFTLGWIAERHVGMMRRIAEAGHEIASHGWRHRKVTTLSPAEFRESLRRSKAVLEDVTGQEVTGYRAPSFTIVPSVDWAFDVLVEEGYAYDSSVYPGRSGHPLEPRRAYDVERAAGTLREYPIATLRMGRTWPAGGGAYLRLLPYGLVRGGLLQAQREGQPAMFYIHPWELDPDQPRLPTNLKTRLRHYGGLSRTDDLLARMLREFAFESVRVPVARAVSA
jgi:polysaccharide deacetylase family protein (PEP-CTERM system associated)